MWTCIVLSGTVVYWLSWPYLCRRHMHESSMDNYHCRLGTFWLQTKSQGFHWSQLSFEDGENIHMMVVSGRHETGCWLDTMTKALCNASIAAYIDPLINMWFCRRLGKSGRITLIRCQFAFGKSMPRRLYALKSSLQFLSAVVSH